MLLYSTSVAIDMSVLIVTAVLYTTIQSYNFFHFMLCTDKDTFTRDVIFNVNNSNFWEIYNYQRSQESMTVEYQENPKLTCNGKLGTFLTKT